MELAQIFPKDSIIVNLDSTEKDELFEEMVTVIRCAHPEINIKEAVWALEKRESKMSTGIMHDIAVPHAVISSVSGIAGAIGISREGIDYDSLDKMPVHIVFMLLSGNGESERHVQILKTLALVLQIPEFTNKIKKCASASEVYNFIAAAEESVI